MHKGNLLYNNLDSLTLLPDAEGHPQQTTRLVIGADPEEQTNLNNLRNVLYFFVVGIIPSEMHPQGLGYQSMGMDFHMLRYLSTLGCIPIYGIGVPESMGMHPHSLGVPEGTQVWGSASPRTGVPHGSKVGYRI